MLQLLEEEAEPEVELELLMGDVVPLGRVVSAEVHVTRRDDAAVEPASRRAAELSGWFTLPSGATMEAEVFLLTDRKFNITFRPDEVGTCHQNRRSVQFVFPQHHQE